MNIAALPTNQEVNAETDAARDALAHSEKRAAQPHPENFKDHATDEKLVEVGSDLGDHPIRGIDPA